MAQIFGEGSRRGISVPSCGVKRDSQIEGSPHGATATTGRWRRREKSGVGDDLRGIVNLLGDQGSQILRAAGNRKTTWHRLADVALDKAEPGVPSGLRWLFELPPVTA